jgi:hypothetical protein
MPSAPVIEQARAGLVLALGEKMAVEGNLTDMNLPSLVQIMCLEHRRLALVLKRPGEEGRIFFDDGQIIHAQVGSLVGEEAVYQLLTWTNGAFHMSNHAQPSHRTVTAPWNHLLLEGIRRLDEHRAGVAVQSQEQQRLSPAEIEQDNTLEERLILLLSQLEHWRSQLADRKRQKRSILALQTLTEMVNHAVAFSEQNLDADADTTSVTEVLDKTSRLYPQLRLLHIEGSRLSAEAISDMHSAWSNDPAKRREAFLQLAQGMAAMLESYFALFLARFRSLSAADRWREICSTFLSELGQVVERTMF